MGYLPCPSISFFLKERSSVPNCSPLWDIMAPLITPLPTVSPPHPLSSSLLPSPGLFSAQPRVERDMAVLFLLQALQLRAFCAPVTQYGGCNREGKGESGVSE